MKKIYYLLFAVIASLVPLQASATVWTWDWPIPATEDKKANNGYANGFYNFLSALEPEATSQTKTFNGKVWTAGFEKETVLAYTSGNKQAVGAKGKPNTKVFTMTSDSFAGTVKSVKVKARADMEIATLGVTVGGEALLCDASASASVVGTSWVERTFTGSGEGTLELKFDTPNPTAPLYIAEVTVEYEESAATVASPVLSPESGSFDEPFAVTITHPEAASILYTIDGSNPKTDGIAYSEPVTIDRNCTLKAVAKQGEEFSAVVEAKYIIRTSPNIQLQKNEFSIELLEEDIILLNNPAGVKPITYKSSKPQVAWVDQHGMIYTYSVGECDITVSFAGDDNYLPQELKAHVTVVAKEPLAGLTVTPESGSYNGAVQVSVNCTDPRAKTLWYHIGEEAMTLDELGILDTYKINQSTSMQLTIDHSCVLSVQAMGENVWSEPQFITYNVTMPLQADFRGPQSYETIYKNGFDSTDEAAEWGHSSGSEWKLRSDAGGFDAPAFSAINPDSKYSLFHKYANTGDVSTVSSPALTVPEDGVVRFYALLNPIWLYFGNLELYICEDTDGAVPVKIWDAFLTSQEAATDDIKWTQYKVSVSDYEGKKVRFTFAYYLTDGDNIMIDDFEVVKPKASGNVTINAGETVAFENLSTGDPESFEWTLPGADVTTSTNENPVAVYNVPGTYDVTLTVKRGNESDSKTIPGFVVVKAVAPTASIGIESGNYYYSPEAGIVLPIGDEITFVSTSKGNPTSYSWTLPGTDKPTADTQSMTAKYLTAGTYDVDLTVSNSIGTSSTYLHGVKAAEESLVWNISTKENTELAAITLGWYGNYGGTNYLDMLAFAEKFEAPSQPITIDEVNIYFAKTTAISLDEDIKVSICKADAAGMPGEALAGTSLKVSQLVDASETYNDPTTFKFGTPVEIDKDEAFFIVAEGFPNNASADGEDDIAMFAYRRGEGKRNTAYHLLAEYDDNNQPTGETKWYSQEEDPTSLAIAPHIKYVYATDSVSDITVDGENAAPAEYYRLDGIRVNADKLAPGIYIRKSGSKTEKILVK